MSSLHLLLLTHSYTPEDTAPQRRWSTFVRELSERDFRITVVAPQPEPHTANWITEVGEYGETVLRIPSPQTGQSRTKRLFNNVLSSISMVPRVLPIKDFDVVLATIPALTTAWAGLTISMSKNKPLILEMRDAWPDLADDAQLNWPLAKGLMIKVLTLAQRRASHLITVTQGFADVLQERGFERVSFIPNGVTKNPPMIPPHPGFLRTGKLEVVYMGNHGESQGLETLIKAASLVPDKVHLTLGGSGTQKQVLKDLARVIQAPVSFQDTVSEEDLAYVYDQADSCIVSLRPDWKSFEWTIPSKTYELLLSNRKLTAVLKGEAAELVNRYQPESVVSADAEEIAAYWKKLYEHPTTLIIDNKLEMRQELYLGRNASLLAEIIRNAADRPL